MATTQSPRKGTQGSEPERSSRYRVTCGGRDYEVRGEFLVGRATDCRLQLGDGLVSRHHARLQETPNGLVVDDLGSRNGVLVNDRKIVKPTRLAHGDVVSIGLAKIEVVDTHLQVRPAHLSTLPPPIPEGEGDMDSAEQVTVTAAVGTLSEREREVLGLIALGHTQREMSEMLHVSVKTIESHRARIGEKLGCRSRSELVAYALSVGILKK